ncbi:MAG: hypothetical protein ACRDZY_00190 [Acidimicrobiales bacterium]
MTAHQHASTPARPMGYADHDWSTLVWGVATEDTGGGLVVQAHRSAEAAQEVAELAERLTIAGLHPHTGEHRTVRDVVPLVYHHAELGWTLAAIGWPLLDYSPITPGE